MLLMRLKRRKTNAGERRNQRGAALVETALVFPLLLIMVGGIIEFGVGFQESAAIASSARAGARSASAMPKNQAFAIAAADAASGQLAGVDDNAPVAVWIFRVAPGTSGPIGQLGSCTDCQGFAWSAAAQRFDTSVQLPGSTPWSIASQNACAGVSDQVGVAVVLNHDYLFGMFGSVKTLTKTSVMRLEPFIGATPCAAGS